MDTYSAFVGVDWASRTHYAYALDAGGGRLGHRAFEHTGEGLAELAAWIRTTTEVVPDRIAIGIEVPHGPVVDTLMDAGFAVHALNPKQLDRFRDRHTVAGAKDDRLDAYVLADALRTDGHLYRLLATRHPTIIALREWSRIAEDLSQERNRLANRLRDQLWRYYPQMLDLAEDWAAPWVLDVWELIPTPSRARTARVGTLEKALRRSHVRRWTADRLLAHLRSAPVVAADGIAEACLVHCRILIERLRVVIAQIKLAKKELDRLCEAVAELETNDRARHDPDILRSLPGVGTIVLSALLSEGHDALIARDAAALRGLSGVAPVTRRSGKQYMVVMRQSCPGRLRTAVYHWARVAVMNDVHCRNRYSELRRRGHSHARALRSVGSRLIGVACAMLLTGELYDPDRLPQPARQSSQGA